MFEKFRTLVPASARAAWYAVATAIVSALTVWGYLNEAHSAAVTGVVVAAITLVFAIVHSTSPWRQALYGLAGAVGVLTVATGHGTDIQVEALLAVVAPMLGLSTAAANTNTNGDGSYVGQHRELSN